MQRPGSPATTLQQIGSMNDMYSAGASPTGTPPNEGCYASDAGALSCLCANPSCSLNVQPPSCTFLYIVFRIVPLCRAPKQMSLLFNNSHASATTCRPAAVSAVGGAPVVGQHVPLGQRHAACQRLA